MGLKEKLKPIVINKDKSIDLNPIPGGLSMIAGTLAGYFGSKMFSSDELTAVDSAGIFGMISLYAPYYIGIFSNRKSIREIYQKLNRIEKNDSFIFNALC